MLSLLLDGNTLPASLLTGTSYRLTVFSDGIAPLAVFWDISTISGPVASGNGEIRFTPIRQATHFIHILALRANGTPDEKIFSVNVTDRRVSPVSVGVDWETLTLVPNGKISARIIIRDPEGGPPKSVTWTLFRNSVPILSGGGIGLTYENASYGLYRLQVTLTDVFGNISVADSSVAITGTFEAQAAILPVQPSSTLQYLGAVYSYVLKGASTVCTSLPFQLSSFTQEFHLVPGTSHFTIELDPEQNLVDDEVVVRTKLGNWTLKGPPGGLTAQNIGYDYQHGSPFLPAPNDMKFFASLEAFNTQGAVAGEFNFRIKVKCYRAGSALYQYTRCNPYSAYTGGEGSRNRRLIAIFTDVDVALDTDSSNNRLGSTSIERFSTPDQLSIVAQLKNSGSPDTVDRNTGAFFTDANIVTVYEPTRDDLPELDVHSIYGIPGYRPCYVSFVQFGTPRIIQQVKRIRGKMLVYAAGGAFGAGTTLTATLSTGIFPGSVSYGLTVQSDVYNPDLNTYVKIAETAVDFSDWDFSRTGIQVLFTLNEQAVLDGTIGAFPLPGRSEDTVFSTVNYPGIKIDGACFSNPVLKRTFEGDDAFCVVGTISGCNDIACGPQGLYCYSNTQNGSLAVNVTQPLYFPAPIVAFQHDQSNCYSNPVLLYELKTQGTMPPVFAYTDTAKCGKGYAYVSCSGTGTIAVVFPSSASAHSFVNYSSACWSFSGSIYDLRPYPQVLAADTLPVTGCADVLCTQASASGPSLGYLDNETKVPVNVQFENLDRGIPRFGAVKEKTDSGIGNLSVGSVRFGLQTSAVIFLLTSPDNGVLEFRISHPANNYPKKIVVQRGQQSIFYEMQVGVDSVQVPVLSGDRISLDYLQFSRMLQNVNGQVTWVPIVVLPRLYDTFQVPVANSTSVRALGFTGLTKRSAYSFYGSLPADIAGSFPNPDSFVTVQGTQTSELVLVRTRAFGDYVSDLGGKQWYAGQSIAGPLTFRFYASRENQGSHGEMDIWMDTDQPFPDKFKASPWKALVKAKNAYRRNALIGDTSRNALRVDLNGSLTDLVDPQVYAGLIDGERISVGSPDHPAVVWHNKLFIASLVVDHGLSANIVDPSEVIKIKTFFSTGTGYFLITEDGAFLII